MHVTSGRPTSKIAEIESDELPRLTGVFVVMAIVVIGSVIITYWFVFALSQPEIALRRIEMSSVKRAISFQH